MGTANAQDAALGEKVFLKCKACHQIGEGAKTSVQLATLAGDGPTGGYFHLGEALPW